MAWGASNLDLKTKMRLVRDTSSSYVLSIWLAPYSFCMDIEISRKYKTL